MIHKLMTHLISVEVTSNYSVTYCDNDADIMCVFNFVVVTKTLCSKLD